MARDYRPSAFSLLIPGILLAATGVGAGDLLTASMAGSEVGLAVLWAVLAGAILKWTLSEGIARWQLATGTTLLEGWARQLGAWIQWVFLVYLVLFAFATGGALVTACGVAGAGLAPLGDPEFSKIVWGIIIARWAGAGSAGQLPPIELVMSVCVGIMFVTVLLTAILIQPDWFAVARGFVPSIPAAGRLDCGDFGRRRRDSDASVLWLLDSRSRPAGTRRRPHLPPRSALQPNGHGTVRSGCRDHRVACAAGRARGGLSALQLADQLTQVIGPAGKWIFLFGFWSAVFSSLLGVWQSLPYMFADFLELRRSPSSGVRRGTDLRATKAYRAFLVVLATVPLILLLSPVRLIQHAYGVIGAMFLPLLALTLLIMNNAAAGWARISSAPNP